MNPRLGALGLRAQLNTQIADPAEREAGECGHLGGEELEDILDGINAV